MSKRPVSFQRKPRLPDSGPLFTWSKHNRYWTALISANAAGETPNCFEVYQSKMLSLKYRMDSRRHLKRRCVRFNRREGSHNVPKSMILRS